MKVDNPLSREFLQRYPHDAARALEPVSAEHVAALFTAMPAQGAAPVLAAMLPERAAASLTLMPAPAAAKLIAELPSSAAARIYRLLPPSRQGELSEHLGQRTRNEIRRYLAYPSGSVGAVLEPRIDTLPESLTAAEARRRIEQEPHAVSCDLYIVDDAQHLVGMVELGRLMAAKSNAKLKTLMRRKTQSVSAHARLDALLDHPGWTTRRRLPVVERDNTLVGVLEYPQLQQATGTGRSRAKDPLQSLFSLTSLYWLSVAQLLDSMLNIAGKGKGEEP